MTRWIQCWRWKWCIWISILNYNRRKFPHFSLLFFFFSSSSLFTFFLVFYYKHKQIARRNTGACNTCECTWQLMEQKKTLSLRSLTPECPEFRLLAFSISLTANSARDSLASPSHFRSLSLSRLPILLLHSTSLLPRANLFTGAIVHKTPLPRFLHEAGIFLVHLSPLLSTELPALIVQLDDQTQQPYTLHLFY